MNTMYLKLMVKMQELLNREEGQSLVEYGLLLALIAVGAIAMITNVGGKVLTIFTSINTGL